MSDKFKIENQYHLYLHRMGLDENKMSPIQKSETKRVFYGAWGQLLMIIQNDITKLSDEQGFEIMESMINEVGQFFISETHKQN